MRKTGGQSGSLDAGPASQRRCDRRALPQHPSVAGRVTAVPGKNPIQVLGTEVPRNHFGEHVPEVRGDGQVATFVELLALETRPRPVTAFVTPNQLE